MVTRERDTAVVRGDADVAHAGYTLIEVMVALSVLAFGVTGIVSMQNAAVLSNRRSQELSIATNIARRWEERLRTDALGWTGPSPVSPVNDVNSTFYLCAIYGVSNIAAVNAAAPNGASCTQSGAYSGAVYQYFVPQPRLSTVGGSEYPAADAFGNDVAVTSASKKYCVNLRLAWVVDATPSARGSASQGAIRADVRVWWYREDGVHNSSYDNCGTTAASMTNLGVDVANVQSVNLSTVLTGVPQ